MTDKLSYKVCNPVPDIFYIETDEYAVCHFYNPELVPSVCKNAKENAHLFAAAPEMLEVLKEFVGAELREDFLRIILPKARGIVAKAEAGTS